VKYYHSRKKGRRKKGINPCAMGPLLSSSLFLSSSHRWVPVSYGTVPYSTAPCRLELRIPDHKSTTIAECQNTHQSKYIVATDWSNLSNPSLLANQWELYVFFGGGRVLAEYRYCVWVFHRCSAESRIKHRNTNGTTHVEETFLLLISLLTNPTLCQYIQKKKGVVVKSYSKQEEKRGERIV